MLASTGRAPKEIGGQNKEAHCDRKEVSENFFSFLKVVSMHKCNNMSQCAKTFSTFSLLWGGLMSMSMFISMSMCIHISMYMSMYMLVAMSVSVSVAISSKQLHKMPATQT